MTATESYQLTDRFTGDDGTVFVTGIQALARLPLEQLRADRRDGLDTAAFVSGYPGSPLGGYGDAVAGAIRLTPDLPVINRPGLNEELAAGAVMGSQLAVLQPDCRYDGIVGVWYGKAPGVERAADALRHAVFAGTSAHGGAVALVGDDPAAKSSTVPSSSAGLLYDMHMPLLYPGDPGEALDLGRHAIALSRATGLWTAIKIVADVADATATVDLDIDRVRPVLPTVDGEPYLHQPDGRLLTPHTIELEQEIVEVRYELAREYAAANQLNHVAVDPSDAWIGLVASGITYREVREALARLGLRSDADIAAVGIRLLKMAMPLPFNPGTIRSFASGLSEVFVIEEKHANIESLIKDALYSLSDRPLVVGKFDHVGGPLLPGWGSLDADKILPHLRRRLERRIDPARLAPLPTSAARERKLLPLTVQRSPFYCSGCPHNRSTQAPEGALIGAGIGCHTMALLMDEERVGDIASITAMGGEGMPWVGMAQFVEREHFIQNLGDGTYFHSGQLAVQAAIAAGVNITYKLLYNGAVAMTGGQDPQGQLDVTDVCRTLLTQGVARVLVTTDDVDAYEDVDLPKGIDVWDRSRIIEAQELLAEVQGVTVLIHDQQCAAEARRARKRGLVPTPTQRVVINHRICEGCGDCGQVSNCLSVQPLDTAFGRKTTIDQTTCNLDYSCLEGDCPSFMTIDTAEPGRLGRLVGRWRRDRTEAAPEQQRPTPQPPSDLPDPVLVVPGDDMALRITGIGGTGVVTVAQVLGTAAMLDGFHVRGLDQIGLSQKAGPVVSDVRMSRSEPTATNRLGQAQADLLLAFDQLVAASDQGLLTVHPERTVVVGSSSVTPTGSMITHPELAMPSDDDLGARIASVSRADEQHWADAMAVTDGLFGSTTTANLFVVGMAVQAGALPIDPASVEAAIGLNGVAIEANTAAFRWGRTQVARPQLVTAAVSSDQASVAQAATSLSPAQASAIEALDVSAELTARLRMLAAELVAWGDETTAAEFLDALAEVRQAERAGVPGSESLTAAVADGLFKLTAYKDEYEVARLMLDADGTAAARDLAAGGGTVAWRLHPPMLRALGMEGKITLGSWATPAIRALARSKRLRGTAADPFRFAEVRKVERELPGEYRSAVESTLAGLSPETIAQAIEISELPDLVRGYEDIKLANVARYRERLAELLA
ncbi:MAG: indolepyruvate ferredoxin oxidoreductase family protein [Actinomycetota bacterium]